MEPKQPPQEPKYRRVDELIAKLRAASPDALDDVEDVQAALDELCGHQKVRCPLCGGEVEI